MTTLIIHVGQHKTGSKALQSALYANRPYLISHGINYPFDPKGVTSPRPYEMNHYLLFNALRAAVDSRENSATLDHLRVILDNLFATCSIDTKKIILSAEDLFDMHTAHETEFVADRIAFGASLLASELKERDYDLRLVCYVRRQDHLLAAHYAQLIKGTVSNSPSIDEFYQAFQPRLDTNAILKQWESAFGTNAILVIPYETPYMKNGIVENFFASALEIEPPTLTVPYPDDLEALNITPSRDHIEYMRLLNRRQKSGATVMPRHHVLESAFRDDPTSTHGIASWLSPAARVEFLRCYASGNQQIASRFKLGSRLFQEPDPLTDTAWIPYAGLNLNRLLELDTKARNIAHAKSIKKQLHKECFVMTARLPPLVVWLLSTHLSTEDEAVAFKCLAGFIGQPGFDSILVSRIDHKLILRLWRRPVMIVRIDSKQSNFMRLFTYKILRYLGINFVSIASDQMSKLSAFLASHEYV